MGEKIEISKEEYRNLLESKGRVAAVLAYIENDEYCARKIVLAMLGGRIAEKTEEEVHELPL